MTIQNMQVGIFGLGHIGLPTAAILADNNIKVIGIDVNKSLVSQINKGICPFKEPGLDVLVKKVVDEGFLKATVDSESASSICDILIVIVPTPINKDKSADLSYVISACNEIKKGLKKDNLVIIESTVPPETGINIVKPLLEESGLTCGKDFLLAYSPERALPNNTLYEMTHNVRVVGGYNKRSVNRAKLLYSNITSGKIIEVKDITSAEMVKLAENTYRDVNIALSNEFALICENINVDVNDIIKAANFHPRVNIHTPGPGVGGHCIPIDPYFLIEIGEKYNFKTDLIKTSRKINNFMPEHVVDILLDNINTTDYKNYTVSILGLAYKGNVDDIRDSPSIELINLLKSKNFNVVVHDPFVKDEIIQSFDVKTDTYENVLSGDCVILMTDHDLYKNIQPCMLPNKFIIVARGILDAKKFRNNDINYQGIGDIKK